jgi:uncharacterized protein (DUF1501 family)
MIGAAMSPLFLARTAATAETLPRVRKRTLVCIFQRGAVDGVNMVVPFREEAYYRLRRSIAVPQPGGNNGETAIDLDGSFGLHPGLAAFKPLYDARMLAVVHATGSPDNTRSHFDAQDYMESGAPGNKGVHDGWLNRFLGARREGDATTFRALSVTPNLPRSLQGMQPALAIPNVNQFGVRGGAGMEKGFEGMYAQTVNDSLRGTGKESFAAVNQLHERLGRGQYQPANGATYGGNPFARQMEQIAQLIKADLGVEIACAEVGGWDTHANEGAARGQLSNNLRNFSEAIAAFVRDMGDRMADITILTMSEFGRKIEENGSGGTDHGHANVNFVIGAHVRGGRVYGQWPGLEQHQLYEGRDLAVTTDFRDVFGEIVVKFLGCNNTGSIFPGYGINSAQFRGFMA